MQKTRVAAYILVIVSVITLSGCGVFADVTLGVDQNCPSLICPPNIQFDVRP